MQKNVRFFIFSVKDEDGSVVKDFDIFSLLLSFQEKLNLDVSSIRKEIDGRIIRCLPPKVVSKDLKQIVVSFGRKKNEDLYHEDPDEINMSVIDETIYDMNTLFYSGIHKVGFLTLEKNGPSYLAVAKYLSNYCEYNISIVPVIKEITISELRNTQKARGFGVEFYINESLMKQIEIDNKMNKKSTIIQSLVPSLAKKSKELNCSVIQVNFGFDKSDLRSCLNISTVLTILEELDISQDFIKDFYIRGSKSARGSVKKMSIKNKNLYVNHTFHLGGGVKFDSEYIRENGQVALQSHIDEMFNFIEQYAD